LLACRELRIRRLLARKAGGSPYMFSEQELQALDLMAGKSVRTGVHI